MNGVEKELGMDKMNEKITALPAIIILMIVCISSLAIAMYSERPILMFWCVPIMAILSLVIPEKWWY